MLEAAVVLELVLGKYVEAAVIAGLLLFNAVIGLVQEGRAQHTLAALKSRLALTASVRRDGAWTTLPAADLVPGDVIKLSLGGVVAADARLTAGDVLLDQSMLTGESVPIEAGPGCRPLPAPWCGGARPWPRSRRPACAPNSAAPRSWSRTAHVVSSQQKAVVRVVRNLVVFAGCVIVVLAVYAAVLHLPLAAIVPLVLTARARLDSGRAAGDVHAGGGDRREGAGETGRAADPARRRSMKPARWTCCASTRPAR